MVWIGNNTMLLVKVEPKKSIGWLIAASLHRERNQSSSLPSRTRMRPRDRRLERGATGKPGSQTCQRKQLPLRNCFRPPAYPSSAPRCSRIGTTPSSRLWRAQGSSLMDGASDRAVRRSIVRQFSPGPVQDAESLESSPLPALRVRRSPFG